MLFRGELGNSYRYIRLTINGKMADYVEQNMFYLYESSAENISSKQNSIYFFLSL
jgi:hypothetical protein